ncbi:MAG: hypothetical protein HYZ20_15535 [Burkholderiales bacterium]|nr:hypothetical protein [Burkholderiales bacterium]
MSTLLAFSLADPIAAAARRASDPAHVHAVLRRPRSTAGDAPATAVR